MATDDSGRESTPKFHRVDDTRQAKMLSAAGTRKYFEPFLARETSVKQAADVVGCSLNAMLYRVKTFIEAGLVRRVGERKRAGRPIKIYRSVHDAYFVPYSLTPFANLEDSFYAHYEAIFRRLARAQAWHYRQHHQDGQQLWRDARGEVWSPDFDRRDTEADRLDREERIGIDFAAEVRLDGAEAQSLARTLARLRQAQTTKKPARQTRTYLFGVYLAATAD